MPRAQLSPCAQFPACGKAEPGCPGPRHTASETRHPSRDQNKDPGDQGAGRSSFLSCCQCPLPGCPVDAARSAGHQGGAAHFASGAGRQSGWNWVSTGRRAQGRWDVGHARSREPRGGGVGGGLTYLRDSRRRHQPALETPASAPSHPVPCVVFPTHQRLLPGPGADPAPGSWREREASGQRVARSRRLCSGGAARHAGPRSPCPREEHCSLLLGASSPAGWSQPPCPASVRAHIRDLGRAPTGLGKRKLIKTQTKRNAANVPQPPLSPPCPGLPFTSQRQTDGHVRVNSKEKCQNNGRWRKKSLQPKTFKH